MPGTEGTLEFKSGEYAIKAPSSSIKAHIMCMNIDRARFGTAQRFGFDRASENSFCFVRFSICHYLLLSIAYVLQYDLLV